MIGDFLTMTFKGSNNAGMGYLVQPSSPRKSHASPVRLAKSILASLVDCSRCFVVLFHRGVDMEIKVIERRFDNNLLNLIEGSIS